MQAGSKEQIANLAINKYITCTLKHVHQKKVSKKGFRGSCNEPKVWNLEEESRNKFSLAGVREPSPKFVLQLKGI